MSNTLVFAQSKQTPLISALAGVVLATGIVVVLSSEKAGGFILSEWQNAAIYIAVVTASIFFGAKICAKHKHRVNTDSGKPESSPS